MQKKDERWMRVKVAKQFSRVLYAMVAGQQVQGHACCQQRHYLLEKLLAFHGVHGTALAQRRADLEAVIGQLPASSYAEEARPLQEELEKLGKRKRGPQELGEIIPIVLARLGVAPVECTGEGTDLG